MPVGRLNDNLQVTAFALSETSPSEDAQPAQRATSLDPWDPQYHLRKDLSPAQRSSCFDMYRNIQKLEQATYGFLGGMITSAILLIPETVRLGSAIFHALIGKPVSHEPADGLMLSLATGGLLISFNGMLFSARRAGSLLIDYTSFCVAPPPRPSFAEAGEPSPAEDEAAQRSIDTVEGLSWGMAFKSALDYTLQGVNDLKSAVAGAKSLEFGIVFPGQRMAEENQKFFSGFNGI